MTKSIVKMLTLMLLTILLNTNTITSYRILGLFPHPGLSHFKVFHPVMKGLANVGHDVTVLSYFPDSIKSTNYTDLKLIGLEALTNSVDLSLFSKRYSFGHFIEFFMLYDWGVAACENALKSNEIEKILNKNNKRYDLVIIEQFNSDCMMGIAWKLNVPVIGLSSTVLLPWHYDRVGNPHIPSYIPALFMGYSDEMTLLERLANWITVHGLQLMYRHINEPTIDKLLRQHLGNDMPYIRDLTKNINLILINQHYSLSGPKPSAPGVIEIGGVHIAKDTKPIASDLLNLLNSANDGVIYISWGSMIRAETLPSETRDQILQAFSSFKNKIFLWKWENDTLPNKPNNVFVRKWLPQRDILCHPKVRVFITHGGLLGSSEAAYCGVPVIVTPFYGDQFLNAAALEKRGMGKIVHYEKINKKNIEDAINYALQDSVYNNAKKVSYSFKNRLTDPLTTAIWWIEHTIATGGLDSIRSHSIDMPFYSYYLLDVYFIVISILFICIISWIIILKQFCKRGKLLAKKNN